MVTLPIDKHHVQTVTALLHAACSSTFYKQRLLCPVRSRQLCRRHIHMHPFVPVVQMTSRGAQMVAGILGKDIWLESNSVTASYLPFVSVNMFTAKWTAHKLGRAVVVLQWH